MRCAAGPLISLSIVVAVAGCKNQSTPLSNPFLTPDRVPPPSTRILTPGTAQPYYPGDPMPGAATAFPPAPTYAPGAAPPAAAYPTAPIYQPSPVTPAAPITPAGGWGGPRAEGSTSQPSLAAAPAATRGDSVSVPNDQQQLRFASATLSAPPVSAAPITPTPTVAPEARPFTPNAGAQSAIQRAAYDEAPPASPGSMQRLQIREVTPAEYLDARLTGAPSAAPIPSRDGFRPQSDEPQPEARTESPAASGFRSPGVATAAVAAAAPNERFGVGAKQEWLRGQLEYWPESGEWSIRYMGDGPVDQLGGRVLIDNPQVLGNLPPGEFVMIEGQLFGRQIDETSYRPAYRIAAVQRQQR